MKGAAATFLRLFSSQRKIKSAQLPITGTIRMDSNTPRSSGNENKGIQQGDSFNNQRNKIIPHSEYPFIESEGKEDIHLIGELDPGIADKLLEQYYSINPISNEIKELYKFIKNLLTEQSVSKNKIYNFTPDALQDYNSPIVELLYPYYVTTREAMLDLIRKAPLTQDHPTILSGRYIAINLLNQWIEKHIKQHCQFRESLLAIEKFNPPVATTLFEYYLAQMNQAQMAFQDLQVIWVTLRPRLRELQSRCRMILDIFKLNENVQNRLADLANKNYADLASLRRLDDEVKINIEKLIHEITDLSLNEVTIENSYVHTRAILKSMFIVSESLLISTNH